MTFIKVNLLSIVTLKYLKLVTMSIFLLLISIVGDVEIFFRRKIIAFDFFIDILISIFFLTFLEMFLELD